MAKITFSDMTPEELIEEMAETFSIPQLQSAVMQRMILLAKAHAAQESIHVYCDGGCSFNGQTYAAGYYSFHAYEGPSRIGGCERAVLPLTLKQTSNTAEYYAMLQSLLWVHEELRGGPRCTVVIHTDSALVYGQMCLHWKHTTAHLSQLWQECMDLMDELAEYHDVEIKKEPREIIERELGH